MAVSFIFGATVVELQNPVLGNTYTRQKHFALGRTAAGQLYAYSKGVDVKRIVVAWENLREDEKNALENFFFTTVGGPANPFTYIDHTGVSWTARFVVDEIIFEEVDDEVAMHSSFVVGGRSCPTTVRKDSIYRTSVEMEVG